MYANMLNYVFLTMGSELILNPHCQRKKLYFEDQTIIVHVISHTKKYTKLIVMCDWDEETDRYTTVMNFKLRNKYSLTFEVMD